MMYRFESNSVIVHLIFFVACASLCTAGCANSGRTLEADPKIWASSINIGDHLRVTTTSGTKKDVHVTAVSESGISDNKGFIPYSVIQSIRVLPSRSRGSDNTMPLIILTIVVVAGIAALLASEIDEGFVQPNQ